MKRHHEFRYAKLANLLREQIYSGYLKPGDFLMSENELCNYYQMSRTSVRKSLEQLLKEGLIVKKAGLGTIVSPDLVIPKSQKKVLRIIATAPSHFVDICMPKLIDSFKRSHPNVDVKLLSFPNVDFWETIRTAGEMGLQPDLVFVTDRQYQDVGHLESFVDLKPILQRELELMYPEMIRAFSEGDAVRVVPVTFSTVHLAYNPGLFDRHGVPRPGERWTSDTFLEAANRLTLDTDGDGILDLYGFSLSASISRWPVIALQNGVDFRAKTKREPVVRTLGYMHDLLYRHRVATLYSSARFRLNSEAFIREKAAMVLTTAIELAGWRNDQMPFEPLVAPLPFGNIPSTLLVANAFMIPADAGDVELASLFLKHIYAENLQSEWCRETRFLSALRNVNESLWDRQTLESLNIVDGGIANSYFLHQVFPDPQIVEDLESEMELYWAGLESAESFADRLLRMTAE